MAKSDFIELTEGDGKVSIRKASIDSVYIAAKFSLRTRLYNLIHSDKRDYEELTVVRVGDMVFTTAEPMDSILKKVYK